MKRSITKAVLDVTGCLINSLPFNRLVASSAANTFAANTNTNAFIFTNALRTAYN